MAASQAVNPLNWQSFLFLLENAGHLKQDKKPKGHRLSSIGSRETWGEETHYWTQPSKLKWITACSQGYCPVTILPSASRLISNHQLLVLAPPTPSFSLHWTDNAGPAAAENYILLPAPVSSSPCSRWSSSFATRTESPSGGTNSKVTFNAKIGDKRT